MPFLGDRFRAAREARGLTLADVADRIHIRALYLDCIEREEWRTIGEPVYTRGFVRAYARFLGLPTDEAVAEYAAAAGVSPGAPQPAPPPPPPDRALGAKPRPVTPSAPPRDRERLAPSATRKQPRPSSARRENDTIRREQRRPSPLLWVAAAVALLLVVAVAYTFVDRPGGALVADAPAGTPAPVARPAATARPTPPPPSPTPAPARTLSLAVSQRSWVSVEVDGRSQLAANLDPGTTKVFHGATATVRAGNAGGVSVTVNGRAVGTLGAPGSVVQRTFQLAQGGPGAGR